MRHRIPGGEFRSQIDVALSLIPERVRGLIRCRFYCGIDPIFAGLARYGDAGAVADGRSYRNTAHVLLAEHERAPVTTVVLPKPIGVHHTIHELGHVLDEATGFEHDAEPVTEYAQTNRMEAFAEAFTAWLVPGYLPWGNEDLLEDRATVAYFEGLAK